MLLGVGLGSGLDEVGTAAAEVPAGEDGVRSAVLDTGGGTTLGLDELTAEDEPAGGGRTALLLGAAGAELAGAELVGTEVAGALEDTERLDAGELDVGELGAGELGTGLDVLGAGLEVLGVAVPGRLVGTVGVGRVGLGELGGTVPAQLSRMLLELTTAPSRPITRTWYLAGWATTWLRVMTEALGSSKLIRVPTGSVPASRPSCRTSSTV